MKNLLLVPAAIFALVIAACGPSVGEAPKATYVFTPTVVEFYLEDGTRCVMFSTVPDTSARAGASGASCDWKSKD